MKVKLQTVLDTQQALGQLSRISFPATVAYRLNKNLRLAQQEFSHFDEARIKILKELGTLNEAGTDYELSTENRKLFDDQIKALLDTEIDIAFMVVPIEMLGDAKIPPAAIGALEDIVITVGQDAPGI